MSVYLSQAREIIQHQIEMCELEIREAPEKQLPRDYVARLGSDLTALTRAADVLDSKAEQDAMVWKGVARDLSDFMLNAYSKGDLQAKSHMNALDQTAAHFRPPVGKFTGRSLYNSIKGRDDYEKNPTPTLKKVTR